LEVEIHTSTIVGGPKVNFTLYIMTEVVNLDTTWSIR